MTFIFAANTPSGPVVNAWVGWDLPLSADSLNKGIEPPAWIPITMLVDTGATISSVSTEVVRRLGLTPRGEIQLKTASLKDVETRPSYDVSLHLSDATSTSSHRSVRIIEYAVGSDGVQGLLGWDVLQHCSITYNKENRLFSLDF